MNRINLIALGVENMEAMLAFYRAIGFQTKERENNPPIVFFDNQGSKLELYPIDGLAQDISQTNPPEINRQGFCGITFACNAKSEQEVDQMMERVRAAGGQVVKEPEKVFWGGYSGYFRDPEGYYWEIAYGPSWKFDAQDMLVIE